MKTKRHRRSRASSKAEMQIAQELAAQQMSGIKALGNTMKALDQAGTSMKRVFESGKRGEA